MENEGEKKAKNGSILIAPFSYIYRDSPKSHGLSSRKELKEYRVST